MQSPSVAIVILNWNGKKFLQQFLPSVLNSTYPNKRVIVADNASNDDSIQFLEDQFPHVELLINSTNNGYAGGYNWALKQIEADYFVLLNSDVEVERNWLEPMLALLEADDSIAACQPKLLAYHEKDNFEYAGACGGWLDSLGYPFTRGRVFDTIEKDYGQYDDAVPCFWASGAALFIRSRAFNEIGGFYTYYFAHQEEIDLCWRLQRKGYRIFVQPASKVYHVGGGTLPKGNSRKSFLNFRNNLIMLWRNHGWLKRAIILPVRMALDAITAWRGILGGDRAIFLSILKAHFSFYYWLIFLKDNQQYINKKDVCLEGYFYGSVVWQYFIRKRRKFSEIVLIK